MGSYAFDGTDDYLSHAAGAAIVTAPFTVGIWSRFTANSFHAPGGLAGTGTNVNVNRWQGLWVEANAGTKRTHAVVASSGDSASASTTNGATINTWHSHVAVHASATDRRAFRDGGNKGTNTTNFAHGTQIDRILVGRGENSGGAFWYLPGQAGWMFVWNVALSDSEVSDWHGGTIPQEGNLIAAYDLTQDWGAGPISNAVNPGTYDLTINGATYDSGQSPPVSYTFGGAPPSTTRGMPFGARGTAFNGGRTFHGILR